MTYEKFDLNLFALFDIMMKRRNVTATARELGVTPSAVSHGLARLRRLLGDELFIAGSSGMQPTARAMELAPNVHDGLNRLAHALEHRPFDPAETTRTFVVGASDFVTTLILSRVVQKVAAMAPYVHIKIFPLGRMDVVQELEQDRLQVVLGWFDRLPNDVERRMLFTEHEAIVVRHSHPLTRTKPTYAQILKFPHVVVDLTGSEGMAKAGYVDDRGVVRRVWMERLLIDADTMQQTTAVGHVAATVPHFYDVPAMLEGSDMVATLPRRLALQLAERDKLAVLDLPYTPLTVTVEMIWHTRGTADTGLRWLMSLIAAAAEQVSAE